MSKETKRELFQRQVTLHMSKSDKPYLTGVINKVDNVVFVNLIDIDTNKKIKPETLHRNYGLGDLLVTYQSYNIEHFENHTQLTLFKVNKIELYDLPVVK